MVLSLGKYVHVGIVIAGCLLIVGIAMAASTCPFPSSELPSEISFGYVTADMNTVGSVNGIIGYNSLMSYATSGEINTEATQNQLVHGRGDLQLVVANSLTSDAIMGQLGGSIGKGNQLGQMVLTNYNYASSCSDNATYDVNNSTMIPYCENMMSGTRAYLTLGQFASQSTITPITPSGGIDHITAVEGIGSVYGESLLMSYQKANTSQLMQMNDRVKFIGTDIVFGREIVLSSKR